MGKWVNVAVAVVVLASAAARTAAAQTQGAEQSETTAAWKPPQPVAAAERPEERLRMVRTQMERPSAFRQRVKQKSVLEAMRTVPRHVFVPRKHQRDAYADHPLPIGHGQTISQPYIVAVMTERLNIGPNSRVLEVGTGSGYQAAVLGQLTPHVYSVEIVTPLAERAGRVLKQQGYEQVHIRHGDGYHGWAEKGPFDAIIVTCAAGHLPPPLWQQLKPEGRILIPIGGPFQTQRLVVITKTKDGQRRSQTVMAVRFVPMTGKVQASR